MLSFLELSKKLLVLGLIIYEGRNEDSVFEGDFLQSSDFLEQLLVVINIANLIIVDMLLGFLFYYR